MSKNHMASHEDILVDEIVVLEARSVEYFFKGQALHFIAGGILIAIAVVFGYPKLGDGSWLGIADVAWFWLAIGLSVFHQVLVWFIFRGQLGWAILTRWFGQKDLKIWAMLFLPLLVARPGLLLGLAMSDRGSLGLESNVGWFFGVVLMLPTIYTFYSVGKYFSLSRALGGDHFRLRYRNMPLVRQGAFRWSSNAMYAFAFLGLWSIALIMDSFAALVLAAFEHAFVWAHYFATEKVDMDLMYGK